MPVFSTICFIDKSMVVSQWMVPYSVTHGSSEWPACCTPAPAQGVTWPGAVNNLRHIDITTDCYRGIWTTPLPMIMIFDFKCHLKINIRYQKTVNNKPSRIRMTNATLSGGHYSGMALVHAIGSSYFILRFQFSLTVNTFHYTCVLILTYLLTIGCFITVSEFINWDI